MSTATGGKRRGRGDDGIYFDERNNCWVGAISLGYTAAGKRRRRTVRGRTKTEVRDKLKELRAEIDTGVTSSARYTVTEAVRKWLAVGLKGRAPKTIEKCRTLIDNHIVPQIGAAKLRDLNADDLDEWLEGRATELTTLTMRELLSILRRSITLAQRRDLVTRNVAELVTLPRGTEGRPSKALTMVQAAAMLAASVGSRLHAYIVVSLLCRIRTEEARALAWDRVHLATVGETPPHIEVWRSARTGGHQDSEIPPDIDVARPGSRRAQVAQSQASG